jgi:hypothetical protein
VRRLATKAQTPATARAITPSTGWIANNTNARSIAQQIEQDLLEAHGVGGECAQVLLCLHGKPIVVLLGELSRGADDFIDKPDRIYRLGSELELTGFDLREVEDLIDEAQEVSAGASHAAQRFQRLFRAEARRVLVR